MASVQISHPHGTTLDDASQRTRALLERFKAASPQLIERVTWSSDTQAEATGLGFKGTITIDDGKVLVSATLSFPASLVRSRIEKEILQQLKGEFSD